MAWQVAPFRTHTWRTDWNGTCGISTVRRLGDRSSQQETPAEHFGGIAHRCGSAGISPSTAVNYGEKSSETPSLGCNMCRHHDVLGWDYGISCMWTTSHLCNNTRSNNVTVTIWSITTDATSMTLIDLQRLNSHYFASLVTPLYTIHTHVVVQVMVLTLKIRQLFQSVLCWSCREVGSWYNVKHTIPAGADLLQRRHQ